MTLLPAVNAPGFSIKQFDAAVDRAHRNNLRVTEVVGGIAFVTSGSRPGRVHRVTRTTCSCEGHKRFGYCQHRGLCIFLVDVMGGFNSRPASPATVQFLHRRGSSRAVA